MTSGRAGRKQGRPGHIDLLRLPTSGGKAAAGHSCTETRGRHEDPALAIPSFQVMMRPVLDVLEATDACSIADLRDGVQRRLQISDTELEERLPGNQVRIFDNRVAWAVTHLRMAGLLEGPKGSLWAITERGRHFLSKHEGPISVEDLQPIPSYVEAWKRVRSL